MTEYLAVDGGTTVYEVAGPAPLIVLAHGPGDSRAAYGAVVPPLVAPGLMVPGGAPFPRLYLDVAYPWMKPAAPRAQGSAIADGLPSGPGRLEMIEGAGHSPHDQFPDQEVSRILAFLQPDAARA
jgi:pimeloyl-ACP methyl ester carboxylesterase